MKCTFCGHGDIQCSAQLQTELINSIKLLIEKGVDTFYCGYYGNFDKLCSDTINLLKADYHDITLYAVTPYPDDVLTKHNTFMALSSDELIYPFEGQNIHPRYAIPKRNQWMVDKSEYIIAYVNNSYGGAYTTLKYAKRNQSTVIEIINLADIV